VLYIKIGLRHRSCAGDETNGNPMQNVPSRMARY
jgi:hypothetical protein